MNLLKSSKIVPPSAVEIMRSISKFLHLIKSTKKIARRSKGESPIFKLDIDCLEEIFEWLSLDDLVSFGQTCLWFRRAVGFYFRQNYHSMEVYNSKDGIYTEQSDIGQLPRYIYLTDFDKFIENLTHTYNSSVQQSIYRLKSSRIQYQSLNKMSFLGITLNRSRMDGIKTILGNIEIVKMYDCRFEGDFYENFLKLCCKKLKRLQMQDIDLKEYEYNVGCLPSRVERRECLEHHWLLKRYELLQHVQLTPCKGVIIDELQTFFKQNPNVRRFSTNSQLLFPNWSSWIETNAKLDSLAVDLNYWPKFYLSAICDAINALYDATFFNKLFLYASYFDKISSVHIIMLHALETLYVKYLRDSGSLQFFTNLRELGIFEGSDVTDMEALAKSLINIERVYLEYGTSDDILAFVRHSPKLMEIKIMSLKERSHMNQRILDLGALDRKRQKLTAARKLSIYVKENVFLKTKWAKGRTDHGLIILKRIESCKWEQPFEF